MALYSEQLQRREYARIRANNPMDFLATFVSKFGNFYMQVDYTEVSIDGDWGSVTENVKVINYINRFLLQNATTYYPWDFIANDDMHKAATFLRSVLSHLDGTWSFESDHQDIVIYIHEQP